MTTSSHPSCNMKSETMTQIRTLMSRILLVALVSITFAACNLKPRAVFLESHRLLLVTNNIPLRSVQVYNDKPIVLRRKASTYNVTQSGGKLIMVDGEQVQEVVIREGTQGVITGIQNGEFLVRFEAGNGKILQFYKNTKGAFQIDADRWVGSRGQVQYAGLEFMIETESNDVILMFVEKKRFKSVSTLRTLKGLKVPKAKR